MPGKQATRQIHGMALPSFSKAERFVFPSRFACVRVCLRYTPQMVRLVGVEEVLNNVKEGSKLTKKVRTMLGVVDASSPGFVVPVR